MHIGVNIIVVNNKNKILLGKRKNIFGAGTWGLPGGHLEEGERVADGALRELKEETGLVGRKEDLQFVGLADQMQTQSDGSVQYYLQICFSLSKYSGIPEVCEEKCCSEFNWFLFAHLPSPLFSPHISLIRMYENKSFPSYTEEKLE